MKDKASFRLISIGFLSGVVFSGLVFGSYLLIRNQQLQKSVMRTIPIEISFSKTVSQDSNIVKIDLNRASKKELIALPGIGESKANAIIEFREKYGAFENISELSYISGIGNALIKSIEDLVIIN